MLSLQNIFDTIAMVDKQHLDIRTITMGISLLDCADEDMDRCCDKIYDKICSRAEKLVQTGCDIESEFGIPIVNKRISVTPIAIAGAACKSEDFVPLALTLDRAAKTCGVNFIGGYSALVQKGFTQSDRKLIASIPEALSTTDIVCASVNVGSTKAGIDMDAVALMGRTIKELADTLREYGIEPDAETVQTYRTINEELWRQLEKGQIRRDKLMGERFTRFLKAVNAAGNGVEMNKFYLDQLSTHPDLTSPNVLDVLRELSEVATLAVVTNGFDRVQSRRVRESGILDFVEDVFVSEKMDSEKPNRKIFDAALRALGVENREHVLMVGDSLSSDVQGGVNAGLDTCWYNPNHAENPGKVIPTYEIASLEELYPLVMEQDELANVGLKNRRHQC